MGLIRFTDVIGFSIFEKISDGASLLIMLLSDLYEKVFTFLSSFLTAVFTFQDCFNSQNMFIRPQV
jgi:hypothetical protein